MSVRGGGDTPESAIDALEMARQLDMRKSSQKFFILVTDAGYKIANNYGISSMEAFELYKSTRLSAIIYVLKHTYGIEIETIDRVLQDGTRFAEYHLK